MVRRLPKRVIQKISQNRRTITTIDHRIRSGFSFTGTAYLALTNLTNYLYKKTDFSVRHHIPVDLIENAFGRNQFRILPVFQIEAVEFIKGQF